MRSIYLLIIIIYICFSTLFAQQTHESAGSASNIFLRSELSTRASAFSGAFTAVSDDENAIFYNPAGLVNMRMAAVALNHTQWFEDITFENIILAYNFDKRLGVGLSVSHMRMPPIQGKDYLGQSTGDISVSSTIFTLGLGYKLHRSFYIGLGVKYFMDNLGSYRANGLAVDAGVYMYTALRGLTWGFSVQNLGSPIRYDMANEPLPLTFRTGLAYKLFSRLVRLAVDVVKPIDRDYYINAGMEFTYNEIFSIRMGNQFSTQNEFTFQPTAGAGLNINKRYIIDYTFYNHVYLGITHKVGFTLRFDLPDKKKYNVRAINSSMHKKLYPPARVSLTTLTDKVLVTWTTVYEARYNVYVRISGNGTWVKLNKSPLRSNKTQFKIPKHKGTYYIAVTSVINDAESAFSKEIVLNVD